MNDATSTDASTEGNTGSDDVLGLMWLSPEERFDELRPNTIIGRSEHCGMRLVHDHVSRQHATLDKEGPLWLLRDCGSKNGTWVNAQSQHVVALEEQDVVRIGDCVGIVCALPRASMQGDQLFTRLVSGLLLSPPTRVALGPLQAFAKRDLSVAIYGETGTGKEGIAEALHQLSGRSGRLVALNCAAVPETMAEALLFGYCKGAFTGAQCASEGYLRAADGGTLFLDEIADLPLSVQGKLLRVLEERTLIPLGSTAPVRANFRLIAACQEPLSKLVAEGTFRGDLYERVRGVELTNPPLRQRRQEVARLLSSFIAKELTPVPALGSRLIEALCVYDWPGNVRELKQLAVLLGTSSKARLTISDLPERFRAATAADAPLPDAQAPQPRHASARRLAWLSRHARELERLTLALDKHRGNLSNAALEAGIPRHRAHRLLVAEAERASARRE